MIEVNRIRYGYMRTATIKSQRRRAPLRNVVSLLLNKSNLLVNALSYDHEVLLEVVGILSTD